MCHKKYLSRKKEKCKEWKQDLDTKTIFPKDIVRPSLKDEESSRNDLVAINKVVVTAV